MLFVHVANHVDRNEWEEHPQEMVEFTSFLPRRNLGRVRFSVEVISTSVEPVTVRVHMELLQVPKLVQWVVLQIVGNNLVILSRLRLIAVPVECRNGLIFIWHLVLRIKS